MIRFINLSNNLNSCCGDLIVNLVGFEFVFFFSACIWTVEQESLLGCLNFLSKYTKIVSFVIFCKCQLCEERFFQKVLLCHKQTRRLFIITRMATAL